MSWCVVGSLSLPFNFSPILPPSLSLSPLSPSCPSHSSFKPLFPSSSLYLGPLHLVCPFLCSSNLNYTWTKDEYTFDYYVGVCVVPVSTSLSNCYVVQKTTTSDGEITFQCLGEDLDVQVTNTQSMCVHPYILK